MISNEPEIRFCRPSPEANERGNCTRECQKSKRADVRLSLKNETPVSTQRFSCTLALTLTLSQTSLRRESFLTKNEDCTSIRPLSRSHFHSLSFLDMPAGGPPRTGFPKDYVRYRSRYG